MWSSASSFVLRSARAFSESPLGRAQLFALRKPSTTTMNNNTLVVARREMGSGHSKPPTRGEVAMEKMFGLKTLFGFGGLIVVGYFSTTYWQRYQYKNSDAYQTALKAIQEDPQVKHYLGDPVKDSWWITRSVNGDRQSFSFRIYGSKDSAWAFVSCRLFRNATYIESVMVEAPVRNTGKSQLKEPLIIVGKAELPK
eukprot:TRINITY_DN11683_c0_g1_i2.p1 TRINITY_DN11683_c0_g1~~TRINITY_DN11683_c0_g1_i2.p1  ORF type:complete len:197 (-),score=42.61 TRINITY_DN11683_c0_g1_i2:175-765(-)